MLIFNEEKQILQKHYAETIKTRSSYLKNLIQENNVDAINNHLDIIEKACKRIRCLESDFDDDVFKVAEKNTSE